MLHAVCSQRSPPVRHRMDGPLLTNQALFVYMTSKETNFGALKAMLLKSTGEDLIRTGKRLIGLRVGLVFQEALLQLMVILELNSLHRLISIQDSST